MELSLLLLNIAGILTNPALYARNLLVVLETLHVAHGTRTLVVKMVGPADFLTHHILRDASHRVCEVLYFLKWIKRLPTDLIRGAK